jgi:hypothetical protein
VYFGAQWLLVFVFKAYAQRRKSKYVICELDYRGAPRASKTTMRQIYRSERRLTGSHALQSSVLGEVEVGRLVYSAAEHAVAAADVNRSLRQLKPAADAEDRSAIEDAESALADLQQYLAEVEQALKNAAGTAEATRTEASNPPVFRGRQGPLPYAEEAARHDVRAKVSESVAASRTKIKVDTAEFTDQVSAMSYGYQESQRISRNALHGPDLTPDPAAPTPPASAASSDSANATGSPSVTRKLAKSAGRTAGRAAAKGALIAGDASLAGAKFAVAKVKARVAQKDRDTGGAHQ